MRASSPIPRRLAFTLPEVLVAVSVSMLSMAALVTTHLFGLRLYGFTTPKLTASDNARKAVSRLVGDMRSATRIRVGQGTLGTFTEVPFGAVQQGNAVEINPTTNTSNFVRYYWDAADNNLKRVTNGSSRGEVISNYISNRVVFASEDCSGRILTNNSGSRIVALALQFYQIEYPVMMIGTNQFYDYYQLRTKVTQRKLLQP